MKKTTRLLKALADENRLRILALLSAKEGLCVCEITEVIGLSQPTVSSHLKVLENAGLLEFKKEGLWVNYDISSSLEKNTKAILDNVLGMLSKSKEIKRELSRLSSINRKEICSKRV